MITVKRVGTVGIDNKLKKTYFFLFYIVNSRVPDPIGSGPFLPTLDPEHFHRIRIRILPWLCKIIIKSTGSYNI